MGRRDPTEVRESRQLVNSISQAKDLLVKYRRHRAILRPSLGRFAYHWMRGTTELPYGPIKLHIEPTSACNLRCPMCPQSVLADELKKQKPFMDMACSARSSTRQSRSCGKPTCSSAASR